MDPQGNATSAVGIIKDPKTTKTVYNVIDGECFAAEVVQKTGIQGLDIIPATVDLAGAELDLVQLNKREHILSNILKELKNSYDIVTIDCPPSLGLLTVNALTAADGIIIPMTCEFFALEGVAQLMNTVRLVKKHLNPALEVDGVVLTMKDNRSNLTASVAHEINEYFKKKVFNTAVPRNVRVAEAPSHGMPISLYDKKSSGGIAYQQLAYEVLARLNNINKGGK
jgi:chromosome partitioning protein